MPAPLTEALLAPVRELWAQGKSDREIAEVLTAAGTPTTPWAVGYRRRFLGLPAHDKKGASFRATKSRTMRRTWDRYGAAELHRRAKLSRDAVAAAVASRYNLPFDLHPVQVCVLVALAAGFATAAALADAAGRPSGPHGYRRFAAGRAGGGNYLADLAARGLVANLPPAPGRPALYFLTGTAMESLSAHLQGRGTNDGERNDNDRSGADT